MLTCAFVKKVKITECNRFFELILKFNGENIDSLILNKVLGQSSFKNFVDNLVETSAVGILWKIERAKNHMRAYYFFAKL